MDSLIKKRVIKESNYIIKTNKTIRETAKKFNVSKSTVHNDIHKILKKIDYEKFIIVNNIMKNHIETRHIKGGEATKLKYQSR
ncbi:MAG: sporulation transcriptional regulator SpoIIID [Bacilli bacterium]|jgi:putative DeoR family transcriptional regulator (stage III sporulation protein D)|nr:sporulation transcriptional regulator SpoIIID [Bacilli bacterium]